MTATAQDTWTDEQIAAYIARPIPYRLETLCVGRLTLGCRGRRIDFSWRPYAERSAEARADYDRLRESIREHGLLRPIIVHRDPSFGDANLRVLIGMRRVEIARELGIAEVRAAVVLEDVSGWWKYDVERLSRLKAELGEVAY